MKKIYTFILMSFMLVALAFGTVPPVFKDLPVFKGDLKKVVYKLIVDGEDYIVVEIDGVTYLVHDQEQ